MYLPNQPVAPVSEEPKLALLRPYQGAVIGTSLWQIASTFGLYFMCVALMYASLHVSLWLTLALALPASGLIVRIFMLQHDCGHGSLFRARRLNEGVGMLCSLVTLTPFIYWRRLHARHHRSWNNLDDRGIPADFFSDCATLGEYSAMTPIQRYVYRVTHHPLLVHFLLPPIIFVLLYRLPFDTPWACRKEHVSVYLLNFALLGLYAGLMLLLGVKSVLLVQGPALVLAAIIGIWLFSVQHRFEDAKWVRRQNWNFAQASLQGTSYLKLPPILQWFSGNIGLHHVHHLCPAIPNYRLQACHDSCLPVTSAARILTLREALGASRYTLWDEELSCMVPFPS